MTPKLRFQCEDGSVYPDWEERRLSDVSTILMGQSPKNDGIRNKKNKVPLIQGKADILGYGIIPEHYTSNPTKISEPTDIIMTVRAPVGFVAKLGFTACIGRGVCAIRTQESADYIYYILQFKKSNWIYIEQGLTFTAVNKNDIEDFLIPLPTLPEQKKIADFLSTVDDVIAQSEREVKNLQAQKKAMMQRIFSQEIRFKQDDGTDYPEWVEKKVKEVFNITRGYVLSTKLLKPYDEGYCYPVFSSQTKDNGLLGYYNEYLYEDAITWTTDGANAGTVRFRKGKFYCTNVCGVLLNDKGYANQCIAEYLNSIAFKHVECTGIPKLMNNAMAEIPVLLPSLPEQQKIADLFSAYDEAIANAKAELDNWKLLKKGLLQQMFV